MINWKELPPSNKTIFTKTFTAKVKGKPAILKYNDDRAKWFLNVGTFAAEAPGYLEDPEAQKWAEKTLAKIPSKGGMKESEFDDLARRFAELQERFKGIVSRQKLGE